LTFDQAKIAAGLTLLSPYVPMLFQGEEWFSSSPFQYFVDFSENPALSRAISEGRRDEFRAFNWEPEAVPDPQDVTTFVASKLSWEEADSAEHGEMLNWYLSLVQWRRRLPVLVDGRLERVTTDFDAVQNWLLVQRENTFLVANLGDKTCEVPLPDGSGAELILASRQGVVFCDALMRLPPYSIALAYKPVVTGFRSDAREQAILDCHAYSSSNHNTEEARL
jgi:maltooligosyltrehalose trehalohydrolase